MKKVTKELLQYSVEASIKILRSQEGLLLIQKLDQNKDQLPKSQQFLKKKMTNKELENQELVELAEIQDSQEVMSE